MLATHLPKNTDFKKIEQEGRRDMIAGIGLQLYLDKKMKKEDPDTHRS